MLDDQGMITIDLCGSTHLTNLSSVVTILALCRIASQIRVATDAC
jgi:hypothetical protein